MTERLQLALNFRPSNETPIGPFSGGDSKLLNLDPTPQAKVFTEEEDELGPWFNTLTPKLANSPRKEIQNSHKPSPTIMHSPKGLINSRRRRSIKNISPVDDRTIAKSFKMYKPPLVPVASNSTNKVIENNDIFTNEFIKYRVTPPISKIGLVDLSPKVEERKRSRLQLIIGSVNELLSPRNNTTQKNKQDSLIVSPKEDVSTVNQSQIVLRRNVAPGVKEVDTDNNLEPLKSYMKVYSETARSLKELRIRKNDEAFSIKTKSTIQKKSYGKHDLARNLNRRLDSKLLYAHVLRQHRKANQVEQESKSPTNGIISEGVRIIGAQRHTRTPSKTFVPKKEEKNDPAAHKFEKEDIKDKLQILRRIRLQGNHQSKISPSFDEQRAINSFKHEMHARRTSRRQRTTTPPALAMSCIKHDLTRSDIFQTAAGNRETMENNLTPENQGIGYPQLGQNNSSSFKFAINKTDSRRRAKNGGALNDEFKKLLAHRDRTETILIGTETEDFIAEMDGHQLKDSTDRVKQFSPRNQTFIWPSSRRYLPPKRDREDREGLLEREIQAKSHSLVRLKEPPFEYREDVSRREPLSQFFSTSTSQMRGSKSRRIIKKMNTEMQAALFQEQAVRGHMMRPLKV